LGLWQTTKAVAGKGKKVTLSEGTAQLKQSAPFVLARGEWFCLILTFSATVIYHTTWLTNSFLTCNRPKMPKDLCHPSLADEKSKHKLKRLIQSPNSFFMDVKCPGCFHITTIFSHAQVCEELSLSYRFATVVLTDRFSLTDRCPLRWVLHRSEPTHRRQVQIDRGLLLPEEGGLNIV
jgi:small subunit ribosomal protein S27e